MWFYSQIWLNVPHFFYIFLWMLATLATNKKLLKTTLVHTLAVYPHHLSTTLALTGSMPFV
jgi:hypothetical protein